MKKKILYAGIPAVLILLSAFLLVKKFGAKKEAEVVEGAIDNTIVLRIANVSFTGYELEKNIDQYKGEPTQRGAGKEMLNSWVTRFIDRAYFLADAYAKGYDSSSDVNKKVEAMARLIVTQPGGLTEQKVINEKLQPAKEEIEQALQRNRQQVIIRYLKFPDYDAAVNTLGAVAVKSKEEFEQLRAKSAALPGVTYGEETLTWPFFKHGLQEEIIHTMKKEEISPVIILADGVYLVHIKDITTSNNQSDSIKNRITGYVQYTKKEKLKQEYYREVNKKIKVTPDTTLLAAMENKLKDKGTVSMLDTALFHDQLSQPVMAYTIEGRPVTVSLKQFIDWYNNLSIRQEAKTRVQLNSYLLSMAYEDYAFGRAQQLGLTKETKFLLDRDNYKKNIIHFQYEQNELRKHITISQQEIEARYAATRNRFALPVNVTISTYTFNDRGSAISSMFALRRSSADSVKLKGVTATRKHIRVNYKSKVFPDTAMKVIFSMKVNDVSRPMPVNGKQVLMVKEAESGNRIQELPEVSAIIKREIEEEKMAAARQVQLARLKKQYTITNNIDYTKYSAKINN